MQKRNPGFNKDQRLLTLHDFTPPIILYVQLRVYKLPLKIKLWTLLNRHGLPVSFFLASFSLLFFLFFFKFYFIFKLYVIVLVLPNIKMNPPQVYMCSPS